MSAVMKVGYDTFAAPSQAGTDDGIPGVLQVETASPLKHKVRVVRSADTFYWDKSTTPPAFRALGGGMLEAEELDLDGSFSESGADSGMSIRRCKMRLPTDLVDAITSGTAVITVYVTGGAGVGKSITVDFASL